MKQSRLQVRVDTELLDRLQDLAEVEFTTVSAIVTRAILRELRNAERRES